MSSIVNKDISVSNKTLNSAKIGAQVMTDKQGTQLWSYPKFGRGVNLKSVDSNLSFKMKAELSNIPQLDLNLIQEEIEKKSSGPA